MAALQQKPVIIIGAGVVGLCLANGLKKANVPFVIYERDNHIDVRHHGWGLTLHWALPFFRDLLDETSIADIDALQVDPEIGCNDPGNFLFLNLATLETKFRIPPNDRRRINRERLRKGLLRQVSDNVHWGKRLSGIDLLGDDGVQANFDDGTSAQGSLIIGAEGTNSPTRKFLAPDAYRNDPIPVNLIGAAVDMTPLQVKPIHDIDPLLFQGCHPDTNNYLWLSTLETPDTNGTRGTPAELYRMQIIVSWPVKSDADAIPPTDQERIAVMKHRAREFHPLLRAAVDSIPPTTPALQITLQDWPCRDWDNHNGRVTLAGDSAHAMTMFRGEAANHGILDAYFLSRALKKVQAGETTLQEALNGYEQEMRERTQPAVELSRQACLDAHDYHSLDQNSAVLKRRALNVSLP